MFRVGRGVTIETVGWLLCIEFDIVELVGHKPERVHGTLHGPDYSGSTGLEGTYTLGGETFADTDRVFSIV